MARTFSRVAIEAIVVGILLILFVYAAQFLVMASGQFSVSVPEVCNKWNDKYAMEITIFLAGALFHIACEYTGVNGWFARNY